MSSMIIISSLASMESLSSEPYDSVKIADTLGIMVNKETTVQHSASSNTTESTADNEPTSVTMVSRGMQTSMDGLYGGVDDISQQSMDSADSLTCSLGISLSSPVQKLRRVFRQIKILSSISRQG